MGALAGLDRSSSWALASLRPIMLRCTIPSGFRVATFMISFMVGLLVLVYWFWVYWFLCFFWGKDGGTVYMALMVILCYILSCFHFRYIGFRFIGFLCFFWWGGWNCRYGLYGHSHSLLYSLFLGKEINLT